MTELLLVEMCCISFLRDAKLTKIMLFISCKILWKPKVISGYFADPHKGDSSNLGLEESKNHKICNIPKETCKFERKNLTCQNTPRPMYETSTTKKAAGRFLQSYILPESQPVPNFLLMLHVSVWENHVMSKMIFSRFEMFVSEISSFMIFGLLEDGIWRITFFRDSKIT